MGIEWVRGVDKLSADIGAKGIGGLNDMREIMGHVAEDGAEEMQHFIATTPSALKPGKDNRIWTGQMHDDVKYEPLEESGNKITARFGWTGRVEDYYINQEYGEEYVPTPMHALVRAFINQREGLIQLLKDWTGR